jgi:tetratricopeptide (TPR) repeat protein
LIFCPSCAARIDEKVSPDAVIKCPVCGTEFSAADSDASSENMPVDTVQSTTDSLSKTVDTAADPRRQTTEEILLERLKNDPPQTRPLPWRTLAIVFLAIFGVSIGIYRITARPNVYAPGGEIDSTALLQKRAFFQHIVDSLREEMARNSANTDLHLSLADALYDASDWNGSVREFETYLAAKPDDADARVDFSFAITQATGDINLALSEIDTVLKQKPDHLNALVNGGILAAQSINDTNHVAALARSKDYFQRARAIAVKTNPPMAARIDTLIKEIDKTGARLTSKPK